jgi:hypothetical protein
LALVGAGLPVVVLVGAVVGVVVAVPMVMKFFLKP